MSTDGGTAVRRELVTVTAVGEASLGAVVQTLLARRANVVSLAAARTNGSDGLKIHVVADLRGPTSSNLLIKQIDRNVDVVSTARATPHDFHVRRGVLVRLRVDQRCRGQVLDGVRAAGADVVELNAAAMTVALFATPERVDKLLALLTRFGIDEVTDTGSVAIGRPRLSFGS
jgi:acetolactate synthase-1/3 small subunit